MARITSPDSPALLDLCDALRAGATEVDRTSAWPAESMRLCGEAGVFEWFLPAEHHGQGWDDADVTRGYLALSEACLTTTFIITQRTGACRRIAGGANQALKERLLPGLAAGDSFATVGISHLTTSGRHLAKPMLAATRIDGGWRLEGAAPWVTGAEAALHVVVGAAVVDGQGEPTGEEILLAAPTDLAAVTTPPAFEMVALTASRTGPVRFDGAEISDDYVVAGPIPDVLKHGVGAGTGGPQTSTLALGAAAASLALLHQEASRRPDLAAPVEAIAAEHARLLVDLQAAANGSPTCSSESLRQRANSLVLRAAQAALSATKGAGYLAEAPAGRLCREALFFLVWSCPQPVQQAGLCELAGLVG
ncbi:Acyl-CoA dehydrogenase [Botrimarina colliarenosi]|uniref:Acyl-CoA dehydrogenase n=1 Tax=Botrimarina colliarenosi TaxID=2528001 RepID=A0A5C6ALN7_9BACT|nr:acyl-CoA dehydrogenase family protein [Botrimarina colliarenosi]TWT99083.1 Acyl-CoA dehydrogenase [Botrimarina colliarenosi]